MTDSANSTKLPARDRELEIHDPLGIQDCFATGMAQVERNGDHVRLTFYADRCANWETNRKERAVVARLVLTAGAFEQVKTMLLDDAERPEFHHGRHAGTVN